MDSMPGIIILNPGQLLYSPNENKCMTLPTWNARKRPSAISKPYAINTNHNLVPGHTNAQEHISTVFDHVIPQMVKDDVNLYVIGITDGAENFIHWFDRNADVEGSMSNNIWAMAFTEPSHDTKAIINSTTKLVLSHRARSWIKSPKPLAEFINSPNATKPYKALENIPPSPHSEFPPSPIGSDVSTATEVMPEMHALGKSIEDFKVREAEEASVARSADLDYVKVDAASTALVRTDSKLPKPSDDVPDWMKSPYDYTTRFVSCPTFSGGEEEIDELLLGTAMGEVLEWFRFRAEEPY